MCGSHSKGGEKASQSLLGSTIQQWSLIRLQAAARDGRFAEFKSQLEVMLSTVQNVKHLSIRQKERVEQLALTLRKFLPCGEVPGAAGDDLSKLVALSVLGPHNFPSAVIGDFAERLRQAVTSAPSFILVNVLCGLRQLAKSTLDLEKADREEMLRLSADLVMRFSTEPQMVRELLPNELVHIIAAAHVCVASSELRAHVMQQLKSHLAYCVPHTMVDLLVAAVSSKWPEAQELARISEDVLAGRMSELKGYYLTLLARCFVCIPYSTTKISFFKSVETCWNYLKFTEQNFLLRYCHSFSKETIRAEIQRLTEQWSPDMVHVAALSSGKLCKLAQVLWSTRVKGAPVQQTIAKHILLDVDALCYSERAKFALYLGSALSDSHCMLLVEQPLVNCTDGDLLLNILHALTPFRGILKIKQLVCKYAKNGDQLQLSVDSQSRVRTVCFVLGMWRICYPSWLEAAGEKLLEGVDQLLETKLGFFRMAKLVQTLVHLSFRKVHFWHELVNKLCGADHIDEEFLVNVGMTSLIRVVWSLSFVGIHWQLGELCLFSHMHRFASDLGQDTVVMALHMSFFAAERGHSYAHFVHQVLIARMKIAVCVKTKYNKCIAMDLSRLYGEGKWMKFVMTTEGCIAMFAAVLSMTTETFVSWDEIPSFCFVNPSEAGSYNLDGSRQEEALFSDLLGGMDDCKEGPAPDQLGKIEKIVNTKRVLDLGYKPVVVIPLPSRAYLMHSNDLFGPASANIKVLRETGWLVIKTFTKGHYSVIKQRQILLSTVGSALVRCYAFSRK